MHYSNRRRPATVMTVHNLAYQGVFPREMLAAIDSAAPVVQRSRRRILWKDRVLEGRSVFCRSHHDGLPDLCQGDFERRGRHGAWRSPARAIM